MKNVIILIAALFVPGGFIYSQDAGVPPSGMSELEAYSIFYDAYRTGDYELALTYGEWIVASRPRAIEGDDGFSLRSEEHTSELQSRGQLVCRLLLEKKNK